MNLAKLIEQKSRLQIVLLCLLLLLAIVGAVPRYFSGNWTWARSPRIPNLEQVRNLRAQGITLAGWQVQAHKLASIGGHKWSIQEFVPVGEACAAAGNCPKPVVLQMRSQQSPKDQPEVEWMDAKGFEQWQTDSDRQLQFTVPASNQVPATKVTANFFRAWTPRQTFAVAQWYAWPYGGHPAPRHWFWADQLAQWQRRRLSWVAISLKLPIEPLGDIEKARTEIVNLGEKIQAAIMQKF